MSYGFYILWLHSKDKDTETMSGGNLASLQMTSYQTHWRAPSLPTAHQHELKTAGSSHTTYIAGYRVGHFHCVPAYYTEKTPAISVLVVPLGVHPCYCPLYTLLIQLLIRDQTAGSCS